MEGKRKIAVFDFDGTLVSRDTFIEFALFAVGRKRFATAFLRSAFSIAGWKLGLWPGGRAKEALFRRLYAGMAYSEFVRRGVNFADRIKAFERGDVVAILDEHVANCREVFIVSASMPEWIAGWAAARGIDSRHVVGTAPEIGPDGLLTGRFATPNCHGPEKVSRLSALIGDRTEFFIHAYGDSDGDRELLSYADVGRKV